MTIMEKNKTCAVARQGKKEQSRAKGRTKPVHKEGDNNHTITHAEETLEEVT
jgi:hypothetical protein